MENDSSLMSMITSSSSSSSSNSNERASDDEYSYNGSVDTVYSFQEDFQRAEPFVGFGAQAFVSIPIKRTSNSTSVDDAAEVSADDAHQTTAEDESKQRSRKDPCSVSENPENLSQDDKKVQIKITESSEEECLDYNDSDDEGGTFIIYRSRQRYTPYLDPSVPTKVKIHKSIGADLPNRAFRNCANLCEVRLPHGLQKIGVGAFEECISLQDVAIPSTVVEIKTNAFWNCNRLRQLILPEGFQIVGVGAFAYCTSLETVVYPSTLKEIRDGAFHWNSELTTVYLKEGLKRIGKDSFSHCESLVNVNIPRTVIQISKGCFDGCKQLMSVELSSSSLVNIGNYAFHMCESLRLIHYENHMENGAFLACRDLQVGHFEEDLQQNGPTATMTPQQFHGWIGQVVGHRFHHLPLHRLCYRQACESALNQVTHAERIEQVMQQEDSGNLLVDGFGMTALHILALSVRPNVKLFHLVQPIYPQLTLMMQDKWNTTPLEYLCSNRAPGTMELLQSMLDWGFRSRIQYLGLVQWKQEVQFEMDGFVNDLFGSNVNSSDLVSDRKEQLRQFLLKLLNYERLEALSLLECALWKFKLQQAAAGTSDMNEEDRTLWRFRCGADVVIINALGFIGPIMLPVVKSEALRS